MKAKNKRWEDSILEDKLRTLVAAYESVYGFPEEKRFMSWFGDYSMWVVKYGYDELFEGRVTEALDALASDEATLSSMNLQKTTTTALSVRLKELKEITPKNRFSIIKVTNQTNEMVSGVWVCDCEGTLEKAVEEARRIEKYSSFRAAVTELYTPQSHSFKKDLTTLL